MGKWDGTVDPKGGNASKIRAFLNWRVVGDPFTQKFRTGMRLHAVRPDRPTDVPHTAGFLVSRTVSALGQYCKHTPDQ